MAVIDTVMNRLRRFLALSCCFLGGLLSARAQSVWTVENSGTTQDLWGIAYSPGFIVGTHVSGYTGFVAVGTSGTILTGDGQSTWTRQTSGTTAWLVAVATNSNAGSKYTSWVVVGDQGTILTSNDTVAWTSVSSGTTQRLNGVAYGVTNSGVPIFLAVGEGGTICTSGDAIHWTAGNAGVTSWLRGITAFASPDNKLRGFIVTGDNGVILMTLDGTTFTPVPTGTAQPIETVSSHPATASTGAYYLAAGGGGTVGTLIFDNSDVLRWTAGTANPSAAYYRASSQGFVAGMGGAAGLEIASSGNVAGFQLPQANDINAAYVTINSMFAPGTPNALSTIMVLGSGGLISRLVAPLPASPGITASQTPAFAGNPETLQAPVVAGAGYQWYFNNLPIAGATQSTLTLANPQTGSAGAYVVTTTAANWPTEYSYQLDLNLFPSFSPNLVDPNFTSQAGGSGIVPLPGGKYVAQYNQAFTVNGHLQYGIARFNADGAIDGSFDLGSGLGLNGATTPQAIAQADGRVIVWGQFSQVNTTARTNVVRLNLDGSIDATFNPDSTLFAGTVNLVQRTDGEFWLFSSSGSVLSWRLLTSTGALDPGFGTSLGQTAINATVNGSGLPQSIYSLIDPTGRCWVVVRGTDSTGLSTSQLFCLTGGGQLDPSFQQGQVFGTFAIQALSPSAAGMMYSGVSILGAGLTRGVVGRFNADGSADASWPQRLLNGSSSGYGSLVALLPDGSAILFNAKSLPGSLGGYYLQRVTADNQTDPNFGGILFGGIASEPTQQFFPLSNNQLLVWGYFQALNGHATNDVARLNLDYRYAQTRLTNLSILGHTGAQPLSLGFVIGGTGTQPLLLRAAGPALVPLGVANTVADPQLALFAGSSPLLADDNWSDNGAASAVSTTALQLGAFPFPTASKDAALLTSQAAGSYSIQASAHGASGTTLVELYNAAPTPDSATTARVLNFSVLTPAGSGSQAITAGFVIAGPNARRVLIRADGPGLTTFGISTPMPDPVLTLVSGSTAIQTDAGWSTGTASDPALALSVGAFALTANSKDSAVLAELPAGAYTAQVSSASGTTGTVLLEIYELP